MNRRLYRCDHDRKLAGVASGLAEYLNVDVSIVRILWIVSIFFGGFGILLYIVMALVVPLEPVGMPPSWASGASAAGTWGATAGAQPLWGPTVRTANPAGEASAEGTPADTADAQAAGTQPGAAGYPAGTGAYPTTSGWQATPHRHERRGSGFGMTFLGVALVLFGALALIDQYLPTWADQGRFLWPAFILGMGVLLVVVSMRPQEKQP